MDKVMHSPALLALLFVFSGSLVWLVYWLFGLYQDRTAGLPNWARRLQFEAQEIGEFSYSSLALASLLSLFLEMLLIRWVSSEVHVFAYFKNLVLVACFLGFGLGCYFSRRRIQMAAMVAPLVALTLVLKWPISPVRQIVAALPQMIGGAIEVRTWGVPSVPTNWPATLLAVAVMVPLFALIAMVFVPLGQLVGLYLEKAASGVMAYTVNLLASLAGIGIYTLLCFLYQPPAIWMLVAGGLSLLLFWRIRRARLVLGTAFVGCVLLLTIRDHRQTTTYWSPYQKLDLQPNYDNGQLLSYTLKTNDTWYQQIVNLSPEFVHSHPEQFPDGTARWVAYNAPYQFYASPPSVLVLGAGMGNDVAAALRNGAGRVVAVEIDPLILKIGRQWQFEHPYQSSRTQVVLDDARSYIQNSTEKFDLIVFSLLDSHTTASHFSNVRIDNFVYTREALERARRMLKPDGVFVVKFQANSPWVAGRLNSSMKAVFDQDPITFEIKTTHYDTGGYFFIGGSPERIRQAMSNRALADFVRDHPEPPMQAARITTDDWPYFYQHEPGLPLGVFLVSIAVLLTFGWFLRQTSRTEGRVDFHFLLLGAGFMLLEAQIVSRMALLFGTTWIVNSIVVSGLLLLIVAANFVRLRFPSVPVSWGYIGLFTALLLSYVVPIQKLFFPSLLVRATVSTLLLCLPVFFAGMVFISSFARANFQSSALGSNVFGGLVGGLLESLSLWFGLRSLIIVAALIYAGSALALMLQKPSVEEVTNEFAIAGRS